MNDFRMIIEWLPSFGCHLTSFPHHRFLVLPSLPSTTLSFTDFKQVSLSCRFPHACPIPVHSILNSSPAWGHATALCSTDATLSDRHNRFSSLLHVLFPAKPHHFSAAKVVCGAHIHQWATGITSYNQWFYENLPFSFDGQQKEYLQKMPWCTLPSALLWLHL